MLSKGALVRAARLGVLAAALLLGDRATAAASHFPDPVFNDGLEAIADGPATNSDAARFLAQATFGPTDADIAHLRAIGYQAWLNEQSAYPLTSELAYVNWVGGTLHENVGSGSTVIEAWLLGALGGPDPENNLVIHRDQLRQRVAFALSEIFVVSKRNETVAQFPGGLAYYYDTLGNNAFGNFRTLLEQVTLSPSMGIYLNMVGNPRPDLSENIHPDENYAREINQLFSIGLDMLNADGTPQTFQGKPIPTYSQSTVSAFAHVFTGWGFGDQNFFGNTYPSDAGALLPMKAFANAHDNGTHPDDLVVKQLLAYPGAVNGGLLAIGGTPQSDLAFALDNIFHHPNVAPFIGKQLIQRLVTSNPSPAYVARVSAAFNDDGTTDHVRGNLKAVVQAILLDPEARNGQFANTGSYGKLREQVLRLTHLWRAMGATHVCGQNLDQPDGEGGTDHFRFDNPYRYAGYNSAYSLSYYFGQEPLRADSVFNFFKPSFRPPGEMTVAGLLGPEFQTTTDTQITHSTNGAGAFSWYYDIAGACDQNDVPEGNVRLNHAQDFALAGSANGGPADPADHLVDAYNIRFMSGQMSPFMRQTLLAYLNPISSANPGSNWKYVRVSGALTLILNSPEYMIQK